MSTKEEIVKIADTLIRDRGFNAFSFTDISGRLGMKNASIHYHFPTKTHLCIAVIQQHIALLDNMIERNEHKQPLVKLKAFLSIYSSTRAEDMVCLVGSLAADLHTLEAPVGKELKTFVAKIIEWVTQTLQEGKLKNDFHFETAARTKALMIITNMLASLQLTRLTGKKDFELIKETIINELKK